MEKLHVLIIDDEEIYREEICEFLEKKGFLSTPAHLPSVAFQILKQEQVDIVILDIDLPEMNGMDVLKKIKHDYPSIEVIMITGYGDMSTVIKSMRYGASDFFTKPFSLMDIQNAIQRTQRFVSLNHQLKQAEMRYALLTKKLQKKIGNEIIGKSVAIQKVIDMMTKVASSDQTNVLITGESGTGKELVARGIHYLSSRKDKFFYDVNCSAIPDNLFESEFFGHNKGSFTGASQTKTGWFEVADKGTLFLDEIGDLQIHLQTKLLRVLEEKKIRRVGSKRDIFIDVRIIAATNQNLKELVDKQKFREDLFYRLNTFVIDIPPLRERSEDIPLLVDYFIDHYSKLMKKTIDHVSPEIIQALLKYELPGNVRELKNMVEKALILCNDNTLNLCHFPSLLSCNSAQKRAEISKNYDLQEMERELIIESLVKTDFNKSKAIKLLNITRQSLNRRIEKYEIDIGSLKKS